jgi:hypothetical protein
LALQIRLTITSWIGAADDAQEDTQYHTGRRSWQTFVVL